MTANQEDPSVPDKLLMAEAPADLSWQEAPSEERNEGDYSLYDDSGAYPTGDAAESLVPFTNCLTERSLNESDSEARGISGEGDAALMLPGLSTPVAPTELNSSRTGTRAINLNQLKTETGHYASDEAWLRTDQVPAGAILDKQSERSDGVAFDGGHKEGREASGYPLEIVAAIGSPVDDSWFAEPPVITRPSLDSWSGTHCNIVHIVLNSPEAPPAIVIQEVMAINDEVKQDRSRVDTKSAEQTCLIAAGEEDGELTANREAEKVQSLVKIHAGDSDGHSPRRGDEGDRETPLTEEPSSPVTTEEVRCSSLPCGVASQNFCESDATDVLPSPESIATAALCDSAGDGVLLRERAPVVEEGVDVLSEKRSSSQAPVEEKLEPDPLWKVTKDPLFPLSVDAKEGALTSRRDESQKVSGYSIELSAVKPLRGEELSHSTEALSTDTALRGAAEIFRGLACAPAQTQGSALAGETGSAVRHEDKYTGVGLQGERNERLDFIIPLAPICQKDIHLNTDTDASLKGDQQPARVLETDRSLAFDTSGAFLSHNQSELLDSGKEETACSDLPSGQDDQGEKLAFCCAQSLDEGPFKPSPPGCTTQHLPLDERSYKNSGAVISSDISREFSKLLMLAGDSFLLCEENKTACITLDLSDPVCYASWPGPGNGHRTDYTPALEYMKANKTRCVCEGQEKGLKMPHKTKGTSSGSKTTTGHKSKEKPASHQEKSQQAIAQGAKKQETPISESLVTCESLAENTGCKAACTTDVETKEMAEKSTKSRGRKKKKQLQNSSGKAEAETSKIVESGARPKTAESKTDAFDASLAGQAGSNDKLPTLTSQTNCLLTQKQSEEKNVKGKGTLFDRPVTAANTVESQSVGPAKQRGERFLKCRHLFESKDGKRPAESNCQKSSVPLKKEEQAGPAAVGHKKAYSDVVKQKPQTHKEAPKVLQNVRAEKLSEDPGSIGLRCQFSSLSVESSVVWTKEGVVLEHLKRSAGDDSLLSITISIPSSKDLGRYQCCLSCPLGTLSSEFYLTSDVLGELLPSQDRHAAEVVDGVEEDVKCTPLLFKEDFLSEQYFGENQPASILIEQAHFGEGMHRRAFRTKLLDSMLPVFSPGISCVLKVHNVISQGTRNNEELIHKNYSLAVEECSVQNTAREYIKAYTTVAKTAEEFGEVPEIIPIVLVHRPSSDIPYATLEEELIGDFVKYSVKDGKEINLTRRDSEPGQKCCAFQHWVYDKTEGNLLVTDMQGVGLKLTDVGIATPKKGYKGFRGNCATSFIDQFKVLHQCNKFCELLGLKPLQPSQSKPRRTQTAPNPKPQTQSRKKTFGVNLKSKS